MISKLASPQVRRTIYFSSAAKYHHDRPAASRMMSPNRRALRTMRPSSWTSASKAGADAGLHVVAGHGQAGRCPPARSPSSAGMELLAATARDTVLTALCSSAFSQEKFRSICLLPFLSNDFCHASQRREHKLIFYSVTAAVEKIFLWKNGAKPLLRHGLFSTAVCGRNLHLFPQGTTDVVLSTALSLWNPQSLVEKCRRSALGS